MNTRSWVSSIALLVLSAFLAAGCTSGKNANIPKNTVRVFSIAKIKGLDPAAASDLYAGREAGNVFEGLLEYHYLKRPYELQPALAEAMPSVSKDGLVHRFQLKKGVLFQDDPCFASSGGKGRELVAEDVVYSFMRLADPKIASEGWWIFDDKIVGLNEWRDEASKSGTVDYSKAIAGLKAVDRYTVEIRLKKPSVQFLYYLAMPFAGIVPREAVEKYGPDFIRNPVGTGPFRLVRGESDLAQKLIYERNPTYREALYPKEGEKGDKEKGLLDDAGKKLPLADRLETHIIVEAQPRWLNFMKGDLDIVEIPKDNFAAAITPQMELMPELQSKGIILHKNSDLDVTHYSFNMRDSVVGKNKKLRQALGLALNYAEIIELFYNGRALSAQSPIPPGLGGYDPKLVNPYKQFSIEKAKALLAEAGFPDGKGLAPIEVIYSASSTERQQMDYLEKSFAMIGVKVKATGYTWPEFMKNVRNGNGQMWGYAWGADYPDAENFLQLFYSKNVSPGPNDAFYSDAEFDQMYEKSLTMKPGEARNQLYQKMARKLVDDSPWIFGVHRLKYNLAQGWFKNFKSHEFDHVRAKYYRVDAEQKDKLLKP